MIVVVAGGDPPGDAAVEAVHAIEGRVAVVAADSGLHHAHAAGLVVDAVVGDLDSVAPDALELARQRGVTVHEHPADKDQTDLELALGVALDQRPDRIVVLGGHGGRADHLLGNALLLASPAFETVAVDALWDTARLHVVRAAREMAACEGELCTLLPVHGQARSVHTRGLRWGLAGETLTPGSSRGLSNEVTEPPVEVAVGEGVVLVVFPGGGPVG